MTEVIAKVLTYTKLNAKQLADRIGLDRPQAIYDILKGKTKSISPAMASKILSVFPEFDRGWLMTGEGSMLRDNSHHFADNNQGFINSNNNIGNTIDNRQYYSDSPDVLRAQIELLDERIKEKDAQIKEKDAQIKEKDAQIDRLLSILEKQ